MSRPFAYFLLSERTLDGSAECHLRTALHFGASHLFCVPLRVKRKYVAVVLDKKGSLWPTRFLPLFLRPTEFRRVFLCVTSRWLLLLLPSERKKKGPRASRSRRTKTVSMTRKLKGEPDEPYCANYTAPPSGQRKNRCRLSRTKSREKVISRRPARRTNT